jgi:hypothetical protein
MCHHLAAAATTWQLLPRAAKDSNFEFNCRIQIADAPNGTRNAVCRCMKAAAKTFWRANTFPSSDRCCLKQRLIDARVTKRFVCAKRFTELFLFIVLFPRPVVNTF